jgi:hypothetical protein
MRRLTTVFSRVESNSGVNVKRFSLKRASYLLAVAGLFVVTPAFAKEPAEADSSSKSKPAQAKAAMDEEVTIPAVLEKLELSSKQQAEVKEIVRKYDTHIAAVWARFSESYLETVAMEASMLAAIEDGFNEAQRKQVRDSRRATAQADTAKTDAKSNKPKATAEATPVVEEELVIIGVSLTPEQEAAADKVNGNYFNHFRTLKREIHALHSRLVSLEAEKIVEIEKVLTEEQLKQLRDVRQTVTAAPKATASKSDSATDTKTK